MWVPGAPPNELLEKMHVALFCSSHLGVAFHYTESLAGKVLNCVFTYNTAHAWVTCEPNGKYFKFLFHVMAIPQKHTLPMLWLELSYHRFSGFDVSSDKVQVIRESFQDPFYRMLLEWILECGWKKNKWPWMSFFFWVRISCHGDATKTKCWYSSPRITVFLDSMRVRTKCEWFENLFKIHSIEYS